MTTYIHSADSDSKIELNDNTFNEFGNNLAMFNPTSITKLFESAKEYYPVTDEILPTIPKHFSAFIISANGTRTEYAVTSEEHINNFQREIKDKVDLITLNDFFARNKIAVYFFPFDSNIH